MTKPELDETTGRTRYVATLERRALFWTRREFFGFIARFWDGSASTQLPHLGALEDALQFMAACSVDDYPATPRTLVERLHISRAALKNTAYSAFHRLGDRKSGSRDVAESDPKLGAPEKPCWQWVYPRVLQWLDEEGEPSTRAEVERYMMGLLAERDEHVAKATLQKHASLCIAQHRERRQANK